MLNKETRKNKLRSHIAEEYRSLRTNIEFSSLGYEMKSLVVTSCILGEGKSTVISNLAVSMANNGKRVLIVDCDFKNPTIHKNFSLPNTHGITNILIKDGKIEDIVVINTSTPNLYVIPSGPIYSNTSELLGSEKMKAILNELTNSFDIVLIDSPPILHLSDALVLSALSQGTIIVTSFGITERNTLLSAKDKIEKVGGKIIGVVINKMPDIYN